MVPLAYDLQLLVWSGLRASGHTLMGFLAMESFNAFILGVTPTFTLLIKFSRYGKSF